MASVKYGIVLDTKRCIGCWTCAVACRLENNLMDDMWWNRVITIGGDNMDTPSGTWPNVKMSYVTLSCQHCDNPACVEACPVGATYKDEETGIVMQDPETCIGCRYCIEACPYTGVRSFVPEDAHPVLDFPVGDKNAPVHLAQTVEKCTLCSHRLAEGRVPACVEGCLANARFFGDLNDPESDVSKLLANREYTQLLPEAGTNPNIYYLS